MFQHNRHHRACVRGTVNTRQQRAAQHAISRGVRLPPRAPHGPIDCREPLRTYAYAPSSCAATDGASSPRHTRCSRDGTRGAGEPPHLQIALAVARPQRIGWRMREHAAHDANLLGVRNRRGQNTRGRGVRLSCWREDVRRLPHTRTPALTHRPIHVTFAVTPAPPWRKMRAERCSGAGRGKTRARTSVRPLVSTLSHRRCDVPLRPAGAAYSAPATPASIVSGMSAERCSGSGRTSNGTGSPVRVVQWCAPSLSLTPRTVRGSSLDALRLHRAGLRRRTAALGGRKGSGAARCGRCGRAERRERCGRAG